MVFTRQKRSGKDHNSRHIGAAEIRTGLLAATSAAAANYIGHGGVDANGKATNGPIFQNDVNVALAHGVSQGAIAFAQGKAFWSSFLAGTTSHLVGKALIEEVGDGGGIPGKIGRTLAASASGALAASITGGDIRYAALQAAAVHLYNVEKGSAQKGTWEQTSGNYERVVGATGDVNEGLAWDSSTGIWKRYANGRWVDSGRGYAGGNQGKNPEGINNPLMSDVEKVGPLPAGTYVAEQYTRPNGKSVWVRLWPSPENQMHGRTLFNFHGDAPPLYDASQGRPIIQLNDRLQIKTGTMVWVE